MNIIGQSHKTIVRIAGPTAVLDSERSRANQNFGFSRRTLSGALHSFKFKTCLKIPRLKLIQNEITAFPGKRYIGFKK